MKEFDKNITISAWMKHLAEIFLQGGRKRTSMMYISTLRSFLRFNKGKDIKLKDLDANFIQAYERHLLQKGLARNTISFYMRILRSAYNKAQEEGLVPMKQQFRHVFTSIEKTEKRAISVADIRRIKRLKLARNSMMELSRDLFMFSFYTRGMSFVDIANLRKENIRDGYIVYHRQKTGQKLCIKIEPCITSILKKYQSTSPYLLPIYQSHHKEPYKNCQNRLAVVNRNLKKISALAGIYVQLSMYVARHSWATSAKDANVPIAVISEAMGHESVKTTQIYLASFQKSRIDEVNRMILGMV